MKLLSNQKWYRPISGARIPEINSNFYQLVDIISQQIWQYIRTPFPLPKTHKNVKDPPGHPIVSRN